MSVHFSCFFLLPSSVCRVNVTHTASVRTLSVTCSTQLSPMTLLPPFQGKGHVKNNPYYAIRTTTSSILYWHYNAWLLLGSWVQATQMKLVPIFNWKYILSQYNFPSEKRKHTLHMSLKVHSQHLGALCKKRDPSIHIVSGKEEIVWPRLNL